jgi:hypothetical protein
MPCADDYQEQNGQETPGRRVKGRKVARFENDSRERNRQTYRHTCGTKCPFNGLSTNHSNHWLDYDAVALAVLVFGISAVTFLALNL